MPNENLERKLAAPLEPLEQAMPGIEHFVIFGYRREQALDNQEQDPNAESGLAVFDSNKKRIEHIRSQGNTAPDSRFKYDMRMLGQMASTSDAIITVYQGEPIKTVSGLGQLVTYFAPNLTLEQIANRMRKNYFGSND